MSYYDGGGNPFGFRITPWVKRLIIANIAIFVLATVVSLVVHPGVVADLFGFAPAQVLYRPWTIITYMFVHAGLFHVLFNMLAIFFFGPPLEERWGARDFLKFYFIAGIGGALLSLVFPWQLIVGASAAVYGIMVAFAFYWPDNPIYFFGIFPIKAKWLVMGLIGISIFFALTGGQAGVAHLAHLGGAAAAFAYLKSPWAPSPWGPAAKPKKKNSSAFFRSWGTRSNTRSAPVAPKGRVQASPAVMRAEPEAQPEIDRILDKISEQGMASLTQDELQRLKEASKHRS